MLRRLIIGLLTILGVICTVLVGIATNLVANDDAPFITWVKHNIWWILLTLTLVSVVVVLLLESLNRSEHRPTPALKSASRKPTRRNYRKLYLERLIYRYRDFDMKGFSTRGIYNLEQENVYVSLDLGPQTPNHISAGLIRDRKSVV